MATPAFEDKVMTLREAVKLVPSGAHISLGGFTTQRHPMAFVHVLRFDEKNQAGVSRILSPGCDAEQVKEETGFDLDISRAEETEPPAAEEIKILRGKVDPERVFWG